MDNWASVVLRKAIIFRPDNVFAVDPFEPANGEMTSSHLLKVLDLRRDLFLHYHSKVGRHLLLQ